MSNVKVSIIIPVYNVEAYMGSKKGLNRARSKSMLLTKEQLDRAPELEELFKPWPAPTQCIPRTGILNA